MVDARALLLVVAWPAGVRPAPVCPSTGELCIWSRDDHFLGRLSIRFILSYQMEEIAKKDANEVKTSLLGTLRRGSQVRGSLPYCKELKLVLTEIEELSIFSWM